MATENQGHLWTFANQLSEADKANLDTAIQNLNLPECERFFKRAIQHSDHAANLTQQDLQPVDHSRTNSDASPEDRQKWHDLGHQQISDNKVGVLLLAGGQGTRLGSSKPKGCLDIGSVSKKCLFQIQIERIIKRQNLAGPNTLIYLYVMTSPATHAMTLQAFTDNNYFGLNASQVKIFNQGLLPCFNFEGQIYLKNQSEIAMAPDGNGGLWKALRVEGIVDDMLAKNLKSIHMYCVDNVLTKVANPEFIGFCLDKNADCAASCVKKVHPHEAVGVVCTYKNKAKVVEYSEIDKNLAELKDSHDASKLAFRAANICNHYFTVDFIQKVSSHEWEDKLIHHVAKKKIPTIDLESGELIKPTANNGIKLEKFVFDVFEFSDNFALFSRDRASEFSPLKNNLQAKGDNARTARSHLHKLHHRWVIENGGSFENEQANLQLADFDLPEYSDFSENAYPFEIEISPLTSYNGEGLEEICKGKKFSLPLSL